MLIQALKEKVEAVIQAAQSSKWRLSARAGGTFRVLKQKEVKQFGDAPQWRMGQVADIFT